MTTDQQKYPIGRPELIPSLSPERRAALIARITALPSQLRAAVHSVAGDQWNRRYREDGWTVRQVVHHVADSHINAYLRFRWALTEDTPTIKTYDEAAWAELPDVVACEPEVSLTLLDSLHDRWIAVLRGMKDEDFSRVLFHPEMKRNVTLDEMVCLYAWHGEHHVNHISNALDSPD